MAIFFFYLLVKLKMICYPLETMTDYFGRRRIRKSGTAEPVRAYNHHMNLRLTYYEAEVLRRMLVEPGVKLDHYDAAAATRVKAKVAMTEDFDQNEVQKKSMVKRLARLKARVKTQEDSSIKPSGWDLVNIDYLEQRIDDEEYL